MLVPMIAISIVVQQASGLLGAAEAVANFVAWGLTAFVPWFSPGLLPKLAGG